MKEEDIPEIIAKALETLHKNLIKNLKRIDKKTLELREKYEKG